MNQEHKIQRKILTFLLAFVVLFTTITPCVQQVHAAGSKTPIYTKGAGDFNGFYEPTDDGKINFENITYGGTDTNSGRLVEHTTLGSGNNESELETLKWRKESSELNYTLKDHLNDNTIETFTKPMENKTLRPTFYHHPQSSGKAHINLNITSASGDPKDVVVSDVHGQPLPNSFDVAVDGNETEYQFWIKGKPYSNDFHERYQPYNLKVTGDNATLTMIKDNSSHEVRSQLWKMKVTNNSTSTVNVNMEKVSSANFMVTDEHLKELEKELYAQHDATKGNFSDTQHNLVYPRDK